MSNHETEDHDSDDKKLSVNTKKTLTLRGGGLSQGTVRQNFSHGRSKAVVVETRKRKFSKPGDTRPEPPTAAPQTPARPAAPPQPPKRALSRDDQNTHAHLSRNEIEARRRALEDAKQREEEDRRRRDEESRRRAEETARRLAEIEEAERKVREAEEQATREAQRNAAPEAVASQPAAEPRPEPAARSTEAPRRPDQRPDAARRPEQRADGQRRPDQARRPDGPRPARPGEAPAPAAARPGAKEEAGKPKELKPFERKRVEEPEKPAKPKVGDDRRRTKLTLVNALDEDGNVRGPSLAAMRRRQEKARRAAMGSGLREKITREVTLPETITIQELAQRMSERSVDVIKFLMKQGQMMKPGDVIDADTAELIAAEFGHQVRRVADSDVEEGLYVGLDNEDTLKPRPPVVTIMGHVDHGKTSLLDAIRNANVVQGEAGGITQHIGAYQVEKNGSKITFIDTPGHEAFTSMRARGAQATDIAILVVAADDAVMPQTIESINHAKAAGVPIIVAINKVDKPAADPQRVRTQLLQHEVFVETMGGETMDVEVSAKTGKGLDSLLEAILLQSEVLELRANPDRTAEGVVIEAQLDKGRGPVATVLVKSGTLKTGDIIVVGSEWGKVRALVNDKGETLPEAPPSLPVEVLGLSGTPLAGDRLAVVESEARAREISDYRQRKAREKAIARQAGSRGSLEQMMSQLQSSDTKEAAVVVKADVGGSAEAITQALEKVSTSEVRARVIHSGVGGITESDVALAAASNAPILAFNVRANKQAKEAAEREGIEIRYYSIIYDLVDDMKNVLSGMLAPERRETFLGYAQILQVFNVSKVGKVAGCLITEGKVERGVGVRLLRDNVVIHEGKLKTLKRFKDEVSEVQSGQECGMAFENYEDIRQGDQIECFRVEHVTRKL